MTVSGATLIEMRTIRRRDDWYPFSGRTGGTQTRTWAWDGAAGMAATPWVQQQPPQAPGVVLWLPRVPDPLNGVPPVALFQVANRIVCAIDDDSLARVRCTHVGNAPAVTVTLGPGRPVRICRSATRKCALAEVPAAEQPVPVLHARQSVIVGLFTCRAGPGASAVRCTLASGRGFTLGSHGARRLG